MAEKNTSNEEPVAFQLPGGPRVTASKDLADRMQGKGSGFGGGDRRRSDQVTTLDSLGVARTSDFEQQFADQPGGGRVAGSDPVAGEPGFRQVTTDGNTRPTKATRSRASSDKS
ncbi:hypothetical protein ACQSSU_06640 [Micromonospora echinospora]